MAIFNPELNLWTIESWICRPGQNGSSFTIWVSPKFLEVAKAMQYDEKKVQNRARFIIREAGFQVQDYEQFLRFGEWGLMHFDVPGNACGMDFESDGDALRRGAKFLPHNVDRPHQQSTLMTIWLMWVHAVEGDIWRKKQEESRGKA